MTMPEFLRVVFPAQAGVIPVCYIVMFFVVRIPRASGGDPDPSGWYVMGGTYSPRKRG